MRISRLLILGFGFFIVILTLEIGLNQYISKEANDSFIELRSKLQPTTVMLNRFSSVNREFSLLITQYGNVASIRNRNRIQQIVEVDYDHFATEINELRTFDELPDEDVALLNRMVGTTTRLRDNGQELIQLMISKRDFNDPVKLKKVDRIIASIKPDQEALNQMINVLRYQFSKIIEARQEMVASELNLISKSILITGLIGIALGIAISISIIRSITNPIGQLEAGALRVSAGNYSIPVKVGGDNELTQLSETFNRMMVDLQDLFKEINEAKRELQEEEDKLKMALDAAEIGTWEWNLKTNELRWDELMFSLYGADPKDFSGAYDAWTNGLHPEDRERCESEINEAIEKREPFISNFRVVWPSGEVRFIRAIGKVSVNDEGVPVRMFGLNWDETDEKKSRQAIENYSHQLEKKNKELNEFAYIASHDLQEPITTITSFLELMSLDYESRLDDQGKEYIKLMKGSTERAKQLVLDLLDYSRIGRNSKLEVLDLNEVVKDALTDLSASIRSANANIEVGDLPSATGYASALRTMFQNLIGNALKFRRMEIKPVVTITGVDKEDRVEISITDNGIGIDRKHFDKIFAVFRRLHLRTEYEGTGIGLAHCKKVADMHDGEIWVESEVGEGSTFTFAISKKLQEHVEGIATADDQLGTTI